MNFKRFLKRKRVWYKKLDKIYCPVLNAYVIFNAKGFRHLRYTRLKKIRPVVKEQIYKLKLLALVVPVIKNAKSVHEYKNERGFELWELKEIVNEKLISVILSKTRADNIIFLSVYHEKIKSKKPSSDGSFKTPALGVEQTDKTVTPAEAKLSLNGH